jgi:hypothetical protein
MAEYSRIAKGSFTASSGQTTAYVNLPFAPDRVELWNYTNIKTPADSVLTTAFWASNFFDGANNPTMVTSFDSTGAYLTADTIQTNGISVFQAGISLQYGPTFQITGITKATQAVVTTSVAHGYNVGDTVIMQGIATGVTTNTFRLLNGVPFTIVAVGSTTTFTINWNTNQSNYTAISGSPAGTLVKKVLYPFLYLPQDNVVSAVTTGATTTIATTMYHNFYVGQEIAFRVPTLWGTTQLNSLPNGLIPGSPIYGYVVSLTDNWTFVCSINSTGFTAFNTNQSAIPSNWTPAQVLAVGDVNTGGQVISAGSPLYPSPTFPTASGGVGTINGPAINGAFVNNTRQGFFIGSGVTNTGGAAASPILTPSQANKIVWVAYLDDFTNP